MARAKRKLPSPVVTVDEYLNAIAEDTAAMRALMEKLVKRIDAKAKG